MIRYKKIVCKDCDTEYEIPRSANFMYFCPKCKVYNGAECDYGYGAIVPCKIYLGEELLGAITGSAGDYRLDCTGLGISTRLTGKYKDLAVYNEAQEIIIERLKEQL